MVARATMLEISCSGSIIIEETLSSLQCYSVLSTIEQVLRKKSLKIKYPDFRCLIYHRPLNHNRGLEYKHTV